MSSHLNGTHCRAKILRAKVLLVRPEQKTSTVVTNTGLVRMHFRDHWKTNQRRRDDPKSLSRDYPICPATSKRQFALTVL
jgi:hypothetical protein